MPAILEMPKQLKIDRTQIKAELCRKEFFYFVREFWDVIIPEPPVYNWHVRYLCNELQKVMQRVIDRKPKLYDLIINISPGSTKSTILTIMLNAWAWTVDPTLQFISASYSAPLSTAHSLKTRDIIRSEKYKLYFPEIALKMDRDNKTDYENNFTGSRTATSIGGTITGKHSHVSTIDDPINPQEAMSPKVMQTACEWINQTLSTRKIDNDISIMILLMQRLHQKDPTGNWLEKTGKKIKHICLPGEETDDIKPARLRMMYKNGLMDPIRLNRDHLADKMVDLGSLGYSGQILQTPKNRDGGMFKREWFPIVDAAPAGMKLVRYWDMAASEEKQGTDPDYTAGVKVGLKDGIYYFCNVIRKRETSGQTQKLIKQTAELDGKTTFIYMEQEPGSSGKTVIADYVRYLAGFMFQGEKSTGSKPVRAQALSCQAEAGNVRLVRGPWNNDFLDEVEIFPMGSHDDQVDSASGGFNKLAEAHKLQIGRAGG